MHYDNSHTAVAEELGSDTRIATFKDLEIHLFSAREAPAAMDEIGRIREREFRAAGAGRGGDRDLDTFDTRWPWYSQLVSWDPEHREIVALYRAIHCGWALRHGGLSALRTSGLFSFSDRFVADYLQHAVELGRSVVNRDAHRAIQGLFSIWTGLGAMTREWADLAWFFGNVSLYRSLPDGAIDAILEYLYRYHRAEPGLVTARVPVDPVGTGRNPDAQKSDLPQPADARDADQPRAFQDLQDRAAAEGWLLPPILVSYLKANPNLIAFDTAEDSDFGNALEVAIAVPIEGVSQRTIKRFIAPYQSINPGRFQLPEAP